MFWGFWSGWCDIGVLGSAVKLLMWSGLGLWRGVAMVLVVRPNSVWRCPVGARVGLGAVEGGGEGVVGAADAAAADLVEDVGVDHGGGDVAVAEELLDGADVVAVGEQVGSERVAERVAGDALGERGRARGSGDGSLWEAAVQVVPVDLAGAGVGREGAGGEDPLPAPVRDGAGVLAGEGVGEPDRAVAGVEIGGAARGAG